MKDIFFIDLKNKKIMLESEDSYLGYNGTFLNKSKQLNDFHKTLDGIININFSVVQSFWYDPV